MKAQKSLWFLNHYAAKPDVPGGTRHFDLGRELVKRGYDVTILASSFHHMEHRQAHLAKGETWKVEEVEGMKFVWLRTFPYQGNDWRRAVNMLSYMTLSYLVGRRLPRLDERLSPPDVVIGSSVHLLAVLAAYFLARYFRAHFVMEVRDLWPRTLIDMGAFSERHVLVRLLASLEKFLYRRAERIIVLLPKAGDYIAGLGIDAGKVHWIPNGVDLAQFSVLKECVSTNDPFTVMYVGAHGRANGLDVVLDAAGEVQRRGYENVRFVLVGEGPEKPRLRAYSRELGLLNTEFREPVAKANIAMVLAESSALVLVLEDVAVFKYGISSNKLFDYLASGKPVLFACCTSNNVVDEAQCGLSVPPEDAQALADAVIRLYEMTPGERKAMGERGRQYVEQYHDWAVLADRFQWCVEELR